jgi:TolB-like protein
MSEIDATLSGSRIEERPLMVMAMSDRRQRQWERSDLLVDRLRRWAGDAYWQLLAHHKGHVVQQVGNGLMMEFADARQCVRAAFALNRLADTMNARAQAGERLRLRAAAHLASYPDGLRAPTHRDLQLTSELSELAKPGEVLITAELRDRLADGLDAEFEDLGHWVEPFAQAVRLFRAHPHKADPSNPMRANDPALRPSLAVMPFKAGEAGTADLVIGQLIADGVIARLSHSTGLRVISRHSTSALGNNEGLGEIERHLGASFVLSGSYIVRNRKLIVVAELAEASNHRLLWTGQLRQPLGDLLEEDSELLHALARTVVDALGTAQLNKALTRPLPSLDSSALMLAGISMVHSHSARVFERGRSALTELTARHPDLALPRAWLGMWHALNVVKGSSANVARDIRQAREQTLRALQDEPHPVPVAGRPSAGARLPGCGHRSQPERTHGLAFQEPLLLRLGLQFGCGDRGAFRMRLVTGRSPAVLLRPAHRQCHAGRPPPGTGAGLWPQIAAGAQAPCAHAAGAADGPGRTGPHR